MNERELRRLIGDVKKGRLSRRGFMQRMVAVGLTVPLASQLLAHAGVAMAQSRPVYKPTKRGGGGPLDRKSTRLNSSHPSKSRMPSSA